MRKWLGPGWVPHGEYTDCTAGVNRESSLGVKYIRLITRNFNRNGHLMTNTLEAASERGTGEREYTRLTNKNKSIVPPLDECMKWNATALNDLRDKSSEVMKMYIGKSRMADSVES
jgi:hypothetical protein